MLLMKLVDEFQQRFPLLLVSFCRNQQAKLAGNAEKQQQKSKEKFSALKQKIFLQKSARKSDNNDLSKSVSMLK
jgi:hypothetical protein